MGHVLIRGCQMNVEPLHSALTSTHCHRRMVCVPIEVPSKFARYLKSAAARSHGPGEDGERSGVDFSMRTIGRRAATETSEAVEMDTGDHGDPEMSDADSDSAADDAGTEIADSSTMDPHIMSSRQLKAVFKTDVGEVQAALFQHSTRITMHARFLDKAMQIKALKRPQHFAEHHLK